MRAYAAIDDVPNDKLNYMIKSHLALFYTRQAIKPLVETVIEQFRKDALNHIYQSKGITEDTICETCCIQNLLRCRTKGICVMKNNQCTFHNGPDKEFKSCSKGICNELKVRIEKSHRFTPVWENTDSKKWCRDLYEISKCYMPKDGYRDTTSFETTDFNGIINVMINHKGFQKEMTENLSTKDNILEKARKVANKIRHSKMDIGETAFEEYIDILMELLTDDKYLGQNGAAIEARNRLINLKSSGNILQEKTVELEYVLKEVENDKDPDTRQSNMAIIQMIREKIQTCKCLRSDLLRYYRKLHSTMPVSPAHPHSDESLTDLYVQPEMYITGPFGRISIDNYHDLLNEKTGNRLKERALNEIYITSASGKGKTTYGKRMALTWCQAHKPLKENVTHFDIRDLDELKQFDFFFFLSLKNIKNKDDYIDEMILHTIVPDLANGHKYKKEDFISDLLSTYRCIIFLDGLDEYLGKEKVSRLPKRKVRDTCIYITTSRPWKLERVKLMSTQIDRKVEISGLSSDSADKLIDLVIIKLNEKYKRRMNPDDCKDEFDRRNLEGFKSVPIILLQIICLWFAQKPLGRSQCEVYSNMLELLFEIAKQKDIESKDEDKMSQTKLPNCFDKNLNCKENSKILVLLGELSFRALFKDIGLDSPYIINKSTIQRCMISENQIKFCLEVGLLTQIKVTDPFDNAETTFSFLHQTFQEFLAGLYISTSKDKAKMFSDVCHSINEILKNSTIFVVMCGLCPDSSSFLPKYLASIQRKDEKVQKYLGGIDYDETNFSLKRLQNFIFDCLQESRDNCHYGLKLYPECIFITSHFKEKGLKRHHLSHLKTTLANTAMTPRAIDISRTEKTIMNELQLQKSNVNFSKISVQECKLTQLVRVLIKKSFRTLTCLQLRSVSFDDITLSSINECQNLRNISFWNMKLKPATFNNFINFLTDKIEMKEIELRSIECLHGAQRTDKCGWHFIDLGKHVRINTVVIFDTQVHLIGLNNLSLTMCALRYLPNREEFSNILTKLENSFALQCLICTNLPELAVLNNILPSLKALRHLEVELNSEVYQGDDDGSENTIAISKSMTCLETLSVRHIRMTKDSFGCFFKEILQLEQSVGVTFEEVTFVEEEHFNNAKREIENNPHADLDETKTNEKALVFSTHDRRLTYTTHTTSKESRETKREQAKKIVTSGYGVAVAVAIAILIGIIYASS